MDLHLELFVVVILFIFENQEGLVLYRYNVFNRIMKPERMYLNDLQTV